MRNILTILYILVSLVLIYSSNYAQSKRSSFEGRHFYIGFMQNETVIVDPRYGIELKAYIATHDPASITVNIPGQAPMNYQLPADSVMVLDIDDSFEMYRSELPSMMAIEITSDVPVTVYTFSSQLMTTDAYSAIPVNYWGKEYVAMSYSNDQYQITREVSPQDTLDLKEPRQSEFMVIAAYDSTTIQFKPTAVTAAGKQTFNTYFVTLKKGECYLVKSSRIPKCSPSDLSGTIVRGNKPFGFISGHVRTAITCNLPYIWDSKNHNCEMLMPTESWGRHFITVPLGVNPCGDAIRVFCIKPNTTVTYQTASLVQSFTLTNPGSYQTFECFGEPAAWLSDNPIQISQYMMHTGDFDDDNGYDPCLINIPPTEQFVSRILFLVPGQLIKYTPYVRQFDGHYITIIADTASLPSLKIDGQLFTTRINYNQRYIKETPYCWARLQLQPGKHELYCDTGTFSGLLYGIGLQDAYGMNIGSSLINPFKKDTIPPEIKITDNCGNIIGYAREIIDSNSSGIDYPFVLKDSTYNYIWKIDDQTDTSTVITFTARPTDITKDGQFVIDIRDKAGNGRRYKFVYHGINVSIPQRILFKNVDYLDSACRTFYIINNGVDSILVRSIDFTSNEPRLLYTTDKPFPALLRTGDTLKVILCFDPRGDTTSFSTQMVVTFDCDRISNIQISGDVKAEAIFTKGFDFGKVRVGDTACAQIFITNTGNVDFLLDSLTLLSLVPQYKFDTTGIFPYILKPGDTLWLKVCFTPDSVGYFESRVDFANNKKKKANAVVTGEGIAPDIESVVIDWMKRRIETKNDSVACFVNRGNSTCRINFERFETVSPAFSDTLIISFVSRTLNPGDTLNLPISFFPTDTIGYTFKASFVTDWSLHKPIGLTLAGIGSLPVILTYDIDFDTTNINIPKDTLAGIIYSGGNEDLTIDTAYFTSGDVNSFILNFGLLRNIKLRTGDTFRLPIRFLPSRIGYHEALMEIISDAAPAYRRVKSSLKLFGFCKPSDTVDAVIGIDASGEIPVCITSIAKVNIRNIGNVSLTLQKLELSGENLQASWASAVTLPVVLRPGEVLTYPVNILPFDAVQGKIIVSATFNDTLVKVLEYKITPVISPIVVNYFGDLAAKPGEKTKIRFNGEFPGSSEIPVLFSLNIYLRKAALLLQEGNYSITVSGNPELTIPVEIKQSFDMITVSSKQLFTVPAAGTRWSIELPFLVLLDEVTNSVIKTVAFTDRCFLTGSEEILLNIRDVCVYTSRIIKAVNGFSVKMTPNPVENRAETEIFLPTEEQVRISVFDNTGKKIRDFENLLLQKGKHSLIFEFGSFNAGVYVLSVRTRNEAKNIIFFIKK